MKKIVVWFSAVLLVFSLTACGNSTESAEEDVASWAESLGLN